MLQPIIKKLTESTGYARRTTLDVLAFNVKRATGCALDVRRARRRATDYGLLAMNSLSNKIAIDVNIIYMVTYLPGGNRDNNII